jgi:hypothetical protein
MTGPLIESGLSPGRLSQANTHSSLGLLYQNVQDAADDGASHLGTKDGHHQFNPMEEREWISTLNN